MNKETWNHAVQFHGHQCPGLAIGYRAAMQARQLLGIEKAEDEQIVCITENDACGVDAIQALLSCTVGKGNLIFKHRGKQAFTFFSRSTGKAVRLVLKDKKNEMEREEYMNYLLEAPFDEIYEVKEAKDKLPERARIFKSYTCSKCKEKTAEDKTRLQNGEYICLDCLDAYTRGL